MSATICCNGALKSSTRLTPPARWRLAGLTLLLLLGAGLIGWIVNRTWTRLEQLQQELVAMEAESFYLGVRVRSGLERLNGILLRFQLSKSDPEQRERFHDEARVLSRLIARTKPLLATAQERDLAGEVEAAFGGYLTNTAPLLEKGVKAVRRDSAAEVSDQIREISTPLQIICERLVKAQAVSWSAFLVQSNRALAGLWQSSLTSLVLLLTFAVVIFLLAYRAAVGPLRHQLTETRAVLERQEKLASLGTLAAGVAHEIRNPLASLKFRLFSLKESLPGEFNSNEDVVVIDDEISRLERIIQDFLQFARPSEPRMGETSARQLLQAVHDLMRPQLGSRHIQLVLEPVEPLRLHVDKQQIEQVLINLVQNAADSMDSSGGNVTLRARQGAARLAGQSVSAVILEVADTGKGIPLEVQPRLFDPFFSTKAVGTGLGLPISERIVEKHGGLIQYQTEVNRGTTFQVVLPREPKHASKDPAH
jgi:signal transduction histidine kinase